MNNECLGPTFSENQKKEAIFQDGCLVIAREISDTIVHIVMQVSSGPTFPQNVISHAKRKSSIWPPFSNMATGERPFIWFLTWITIGLLHFYYLASEYCLPTISGSPLVITCACTQLCALKAKAVALTSTTTFGLASTFGQLFAALGNWWEGHPYYLPNVIFQSPSPVGRALCIHLTNSCLAPDTGSLISCTLDMLSKR